MWVEGEVTRRVSDLLKGPWVDILDVYGREREYERK